MRGNGDEIKDASSTVLRVGAAEVELTSEDARAIQTVLIEYLRQSSHAERDRLINLSGPAFIDGDGTLRVGLWLLDSENDHMVLRFRQRLGPIGGGAYRATLARTDGEWTIADLVMERIHGGR